MSASPTVSQVMQAVKATVSKISASQAKAMIKANNIRSLSKAAEVAAGYTGKTKEELAAEFGEDDGTEFPEVSGTGRKTSTKSASGAKKVAKKGAGTRRTATVVEAGPRGFRFGDTWNQSVKDGTAPALAPANIKKLYAHADELGITYDKRTDDAEAIAKKVARKL